MLFLQKLLLKPLVSTGSSSSLNESELTDAELPSKKELTRRQILDQEYWFLRKLTEIAPDGGFTEVSQEALQTCCLPRASRASLVKVGHSILPILFTVDFGELACIGVSGCHVLSLISIQIIFAGALV